MHKQNCYFISVFLLLMFFITSCGSIETENSIESGDVHDLAQGETNIVENEKNVILGVGRHTIKKEEWLKVAWDPWVMSFSGVWGLGFESDLEELFPGARMVVRCTGPGCVYGNEVMTSGNSYVTEEDYFVWNNINISHFRPLIDDLRYPGLIFVKGQIGDQVISYAVIETYSDNRYWHGRILEQRILWEDDMPNTPNERNGYIEGVFRSYEDRSDYKEMKKYYGQ